jgi:isocitrate dehydrogenase (NAD+)
VAAAGRAYIRSMAHRVVLVPGDGVGPEVIEAARRVIDATGVEIDWDVHQAGQAAREREHTPLPQETVRAILATGVALKGPTTSGGPGPGPASANAELRRVLDLGVGVRLARTEAVNLVVAGLLQEDLFSGDGLQPDSPHALAVLELVLAGSDLDEPPESELSVKFMTRLGAEQGARAALDWALAHGRRRVTVIHNSTGGPAGDAVLLEACRRLAPSYAGLELDDLSLERALEEMERRPERLDMLLSPFLHLGTLTEQAAALVGGRERMPGAQLGGRHAVFDTVHGSASRHAGRGTANPTGQILAGAMLLGHLGEPQASRRIEGAVEAVAGGGPAGTRETADAVVAQVRAQAASELR